ncbi:Gldg family protein [Pseudobacter ginsenosidimutans]|uniref:ABC-2 type transport system permease protein n=1 Tax=Pseudobacter ginsenosidimutans TaxID=661488 RepID=A0A4Q7MPW7_9BACT|nr:Gldg family protein [Pseudobacter ginsenosidimutans]QEC42413.1 ABC transporter permease subunit [Pseudobacter ginsenosidimutans]RZS70736.1 ABC-2 type transport system permease protein [Pseudobacter ginsenosidimutans]
MRRILKIAKAELFTLFYSPIAWMILIVFAFQTGMTFAELLQGVVRQKDTGFGNSFITAGLFGGQFGLLNKVQEYLYLYMPLLTMGLMSRELSSGSIKLLYSSPVTSTQIILGKFKAMMGFSLILMIPLFIYTIISGVVVEKFDLPSAISGLLGIYLLMCAYSAIGLFMSSLTSYQVVAALGTLVVLAALSYMNKVWQDIAFVRDLTYWLSISGRTTEMINGLINSEDVLYFFIVVSMFLMLSILKLQANRTHASFSVVWGKYCGVVLATVLLGYVTSRPVLMGYYDTTATKRNTLTPKSQDVMSKLEGGLTITTYVNLLDREYYHAIPSKVNEDLERFKQYIRFKPETKMKYVYYYDKPSNNPWVDNRFPKMTLAEQAKGVADMRDLNVDIFMPPAELKKTIDLTDEGNTFVRLVERENGQKAWLRIYDDFMKFPTEAEVTSVFKRMVMKLPRVGFLAGHGERIITGEKIKDYSLFASAKTFRYALTNQGCDVETLDLSGNNDIPKEMDVIVLADLKTSLDSAQQRKLDEYIAKGGNLIIATEPGNTVMDSLMSQFGVGTMQGQLVQPKEEVLANIVLTRPTTEGIALNEHFKFLNERRLFVGMTGAASLVQTADKGFKVEPILRTDSIKLYAVPDTFATWNEKETIDFMNDSPRVNNAIGEVVKQHITAMAASRKVGAKEQRVIILGDADCISNGGMRPQTRRFQTSNFTLIPGMFNWLSYGNVPVDVSRPPSPDNDIDLTKNGAKRIKYSLMWVIPGIVLAASTILLIRRKRK